MKQGKSEPSVAQLNPAGVRLTPGEVRVLIGVLRGETNKEIAVELGCSVRNVEFHVSNILRKSGQSSRARLIARHQAHPAGELDGLL
jgi:DNA-binding NarL/FixJ family response regulator